MNEARKELEDKIETLHGDLDINDQILLSGLRMALGIVEGIEQRAEEDKIFLQTLHDDLIGSTFVGYHISREYLQRLRRIIAGMGKTLGVPHYIYRAQLYSRHDNLKVERFEYHMEKVSRRFSCGSDGDYIRRTWTETVFTESEAKERVAQLNTDLLGPTAAALIHQHFPQSK